LEERDGHADRREPHQKDAESNELVLQYLTGGSDVGYILSAGSADVKQLREPKL